ncbi:MAG: cytochrome c biogenesis CcdA family protein [Candidatus Omnitrophica bacterium]|nr:cytochrome c biogenesis CcdA family protein [Candidatus Omnitrophota bacterium]MCM8828286.1 cytochrome c biogenesis CcdA family protein [Candidatus Omnitrophota bacterium]
MIETLENFASGLYAGFLVSFLAGIFSFFSPCILPLVPAYFSFILGSTLDRIKDKKKSLVSSILLFCAGFTLVFVVLGASATSLGRFLAFHLKYFRMLAGIIMLVFSLETLELTHLFSIHKGFSPEFRRKPSGSGAIVFGAALGISWTPCVGPVLGAILTMASTQETVAKGVLMLLFYSIGLSIPFFVFATFFSSYRKSQSFMMLHAKIVRMFAGVILLLFSFYLLSRG